MNLSEISRTRNNPPSLSLSLFDRISRRVDRRVAREFLRFWPVDPAAIERSYPDHSRESLSLGMIHGWAANRRSRAAILIGRGCYMPRLIIDPPARYDRLTVHRPARWIHRRCFKNNIRATGSLRILYIEFQRWARIESNIVVAVCWVCSDFATILDFYDWQCFICNSYDRGRKL